MNAELEAFNTVDKERLVAKEQVMAALGRAVIADRDGKDSSADWAIVEEQGNTSGVESVKNADLVTMADGYVATHPDEFAMFKDMPIEVCVKTVDAMRAAGLDEGVTRMELWLRHRFEPQQIGGNVKARIRIPGRTTSD